jgi:hypothetical protein
MRKWKNHFAEILNMPNNEEKKHETTDYSRPEQETEEPTLKEVVITTG